jgi:hypothetical protein
MSFKEAQYIGVIRGEGAVAKLSSTQILPAKLRFETGEPMGTPWPSPVLALGTGAAVFGPTLVRVFTIAGAVRDGSLTVNMQELRRLEGTVSYKRIVAEFVNAGFLKATFGDEELRIQLRAVRATDFLLKQTGSQAYAYAAYPPGTVGPLGIPAGEIGQYTSANFATGTLSGPFVDVRSLSPGTLEADRILLPAGGSAPGDEQTHSLYLRLARRFPPAAGMAAYEIESVLPVDLHVPTQFALLLDKSRRMRQDVIAGSSASEEKWKLSREMAHMTSTILTHLTPDRTSAVGSVVAAHSLDAYPFDVRGIVNPARVSARPLMPTPPPIANSPEFMQEPANAEDNYPAIGLALAQTRNIFTAGRWVRRHAILLSDGYEVDSSPDPILAALTEGEFPSLGTNVNDGAILSNLCFSADGDVAPALHDRVVGHSGSYDSASPDGTSTTTYRSSLLKRLPEFLPVGVAELATPTSGRVTFTLEPGADTVLILATQAHAGATRLGVESWPGGIVGTIGTTANEIDFGYAWMTIKAPMSGSYTIRDVPAGARMFAIYDLAIRSKFEALAVGLDRPVRLRVELRFHGEPIVDADVRAKVCIPMESRGEALAHFIEGGGLEKAFLRGAIAEEELKRSLLDERGGALNGGESCAEKICVHKGTDR